MKKKDSGKGGMVSVDSVKKDSRCEQCDRCDRRTKGGDRTSGEGVSYDESDLSLKRIFVELRGNLWVRWPWGKSGGKHIYKHMKNTNIYILQTYI